MSTVTIKMVRALCRETWGSDWWKVGGDEKSKRKAIARLHLHLVPLGLRQPILQIEDEPILQIADEESKFDGASSSTYI